ncbi:MAG TPA: hypothetical protein VFG62_11480 [Rhodopila sp.]|nr:hypothetical protein [Rhodopila sp.]
MRGAVGICIAAIVAGLGILLFKGMPAAHWQEASHEAAHLAGCVAILMAFNAAVLPAIRLIFDYQPTPVGQEKSLPDRSVRL